jgi:CMP-N-acetylneuraminic acid synthetase
MSSKLAAVITAQESNRYSEEGDLAQFGNVSLLEWKIAQLKDVFDSQSIYVATSSGKIRNIALQQNVNVVQRSLNNSFSEMISETLSQVDTEDILWANVTSPYFGATLFKVMIERYESRANNYDSVVASKKLSEYVFYQGKSLNFDINQHTSREDNEPVFVITNGCSIASKTQCLEHQKQFGLNPELVEIDRLASYEIKDVDSLAIASELLSQYFKENEV